jgi:hypothetical protein
MRLADYDALRTYGRVPAGNPTMFGGFSVATLHWMNPGTDRIAFFLQLFPRDHIYQLLGCCFCIEWTCSSDEYASKRDPRFDGGNRLLHSWKVQRRV